MGTSEALSIKPGGFFSRRLASESRHAVATLEEAREEVFDLIDAQNPHASEAGHNAGAIAPGDAHELPESGGTVGPLPDGTVIEVESLSWLSLAARIPDRSEAGQWLFDKEFERIIDAYNAKKGTS